jgi:hypothetical protein
VLELEEMEAAGVRGGVATAGRVRHEEVVAGFTEAW